MRFNAFGNRRKFKRLLRTRAHRWKVELPDQGVLTGQLTSLSPTGVSIKLPRWANLVAGQITPVNLTLEDNKKFPCQGRVIWIRERHEDQLVEVGIRFSKVPSGMFETVIGLCKEQEQSETSVHMKMLHKKFNKKQYIHYNLAPEFTRTSSLTLKQAVLIVSFFALIGVAVHLAKDKALDSKRQLASEQDTLVNTASNVEDGRPQKFTGKRRRPVR